MCIRDRNEEIIKGQIKELVRGSVEETLNELLEKEAESLTQAARYERSEACLLYTSTAAERRPFISHLHFLFTPFSFSSKCFPFCSNQ